MSNKFNTDKLKNLPILEVARRLGLNLYKNVSFCFLHEEKTPSLKFSPSKNLWKCFGCGQGGDVISLVIKYNNCDFIEACKWLSNEFGIANYTTQRIISIKKIRNSKSLTNNEPDPKIYNWFFENLQVTDNVKNFIRNRKYPNFIIEKYNLKGLDDCVSYFEKCIRKWGIEKLEHCGLAKENIDEITGEIKYTFPWWSSTLFFPFYNLEGDIIYIQGRTLDKDQQKKFKYVNLSGVPTSLFNLPILKTLQKNDPLVITEGVTDCISSILMGKKAIGVIGAHGFKKEYVALLKDYKINIIPDNDKNKTGEKFANKIREEFQLIGKTIETHFLKDTYKDISEYYISTAETWEE